jgi:thiamine-monophosphate kinase
VGWSAVGRVLRPDGDGPDGAGPTVTIGGQAPDVVPGWDHFRA